MFVRSAAVADVENGGWPTTSDSLDAALLPREHRLLETVHSWVAGFLPWIAILLFLFGFIPFSFLVVALLCVLCMLACLRTLALSVLVQRLQSVQGAAPGGDVGAGGSGDSLLLLGGGSGALSTLLSLSRLSLLGREFGGLGSDYDLLLGLDRPAPPRRPASEAQLSALPSFAYRAPKKAQQQQQQSSSSSSSSVSSSKSGGSQGGGGQGADRDDPHRHAPTCSVCLERYVDGVPLTALPCAHTFHRSCITKWLRQQGLDATCPICKSRVFRLPEGPV